jgi:hypothetical protein
MKTVECNIDDSDSNDYDPDAKDGYEDEDVMTKNEFAMYPKKNADIESGKE